MLGILLLILKIIGIILAVLLGLVILIVLTVLFVPVKYNIRADCYDNKPSADVRITAFFSLVRFKLTYIDELKYRIKVLFFTIYSSDKNKTGYDGKKKGGSGRKNADERNIFDEEAEETSHKQDEEAEGTSHKQDNVPDSIEPEDGAESSTSQKKEEDANEPHRENIFKKILKKLRELIERIKELYRSLKEKVVSIIESIRTKKEDLSEKIDSFYEVINNEDNRELVRFLWEQLKKLLKIIKPKKGKLYVHYGMDDPETTGKIAMYLAVLYGLLGTDINILPDFEQKIMEGEMQLKGSIRLFGIIIIALRVYMNKQFKKVVLKK